MPLKTDCVHRVSKGGPITKARCATLRCPFVHPQFLAVVTNKMTSFLFRQRNLPVCVGEVENEDLDSLVFRSR